MRTVVPYPDVFLHFTIALVNQPVPLACPVRYARAFQIGVIVHHIDIDINIQVVALRLAVVPMVPAMMVEDNIMVMPVAEAEIETGGNAESGAPMESNMTVAGIMPVIGRIIIPPPVTIDIARVVVGNINDFHFPWFNNDDFSLITDNQMFQ